MFSKKPEVFQTGDGSTSLFVPELNETYHSRIGAVAESQHVFVQDGLLHCAKENQNIRVFEVGFGTGLNALLTWKAAKEKNLSVDFYSVEKYPLEPELVSQMNYHLLIDGVENEDFALLHHSDWEKWVKLDQHMQLYKARVDLDAVEIHSEFDLVYYDAFGPNYQPNMWTVEKLAVVHLLLNNGGTLVTYCAQGQFRRNLKTLGFAVEKIPGPPGKREMTRAVKL
jgi:tRNA U34 5-methylaminomethyl-2-thiouridine-forming methyltransferase MnmC